MFKYDGPYTVVKKISDVAYQLDLPKGSTVHPVFHVSLLRQALSPGTTPFDLLPDESNVMPRPQNYTEILCNPQAMLHNRRLLGLSLPGQNLWQACSEWIIGDATPWSYHEHWHSYQCIIERSRLQKNWHITDSTTQTDHSSTHLMRKLANITSEDTDPTLHHTEANIVV